MDAKAVSKLFVLRIECWCVQFFSTGSFPPPEDGGGGGGIELNVSFCIMCLNACIDKSYHV